MKINKLHIKNINSLKGEHTIDFNKAPLSTTGLFAITGPTGSGKSTLLDAISLAIYNEVPRSGKLSKDAINKFGSILNRDSKDCFAEVEYQVNGVNYRSKWSIELNRNGNLNDYKMELSQQTSNGDWQLSGLKKSEIPRRNHEIISLNFNQFIKSIVLSQGDFAKFLKAKEKERAELLEKITGTEIYREIGQATYEKQRAEKAILSNLEAKLDGIDLLSDETIKEKTANIGLIEEQLQILKKQHNITLEQIKIKIDIETKQQNATNINNDLMALKKKFETENPKFLQLQKHNKLLSISSDLHRIVDLSESIAKLSKIIDNLNVEIGQETTELLKCRGQKEAENNIVLTLEKSQIESERIFTQVIQLDEQIASKKQQLQKQQEEFTQNKILWQKKQQNLSKSKERLNTETKQVKILKQQLQENKSIENIQQIIPLVESKSNEYKNTKKSYETNISKLNDSELLNRLQSAVSWQNKIDFLKNYIDNKLKEIAEDSKKIKELKIKDRANLVQLQEQANSKQIALNKLQQLQQTYKNAKAQQEKYKEERTHLQKEIPVQKKLVAEIKTKISISEKHEEELKLKAERLRLEASLTDKRKLLQNNEPCPLCGAVHHPYAKEYSSDSEHADKALLEVRKKFAQQQNEKEKQEKILTKLQMQFDNAEKQIGLLQQQITETTTTFDSENIVSVAISTNLKSEFDKLALQQNILREGEKMLTQIERNRNEEFILVPILEQVKTLKELQQNIKKQLEPTKKWITKSTNLEAIINELKKVFENYSNQKEKLELLQNSVIKLSAEIEGATKELEEKKQAIDELEKENNSFVEEVKNQEKNRNDIFGDKNPNSEREKLNHKVNDAKKQLNATNTKLTQLDTNCKHHKNQLLKEQESIDLDIESKRKFTSKTLPKLEALGYQSVEMALQNILDEDFAKEIIQVKENIEKQQTTLAERESSNKKELEILLKKEVIATKEQLQEKQQKEQLVIADNQQKMGALKQLLANDKEQKNKQKELFGKIKLQEKEFFKWDRLNELIGDATGNKYSKFAQELTLLQLLSIANQHLKKLNNRYLLKHNTAIAEDLFVVDLLQGNEERSVRTLSGGESFLISLALALALSDLAGKNTRIESLFIDEGFGSLDKETLEIALSTLEQLQSETNRTIGIISHVEALKERITTQIVLEKDSMGNSNVRVV